MLGLAHEDGDLAAREQARDAIVRLAAVARRSGLGHLTLQTCHRIELYWSGALPLDEATVPLAEGRLVHREGEAALAHLVAVTTGRRSVVLGEAEILGQVRTAWRTARSASLSSRPLDRVMRRVIAAARRVRRVAPIASDHASVAEALVHHAMARATAARPQVLVLGGGEAARGAVAAVRRLRPDAPVLVAARRSTQAEAIAEVHGAVAVAWDRWPSLVAVADVVIAATAARHAIVGEAALSGCHRGLVLADLGAPRNVDPAVRAWPQVALLDLDDLGAMATTIAPERLAATDRAIAAEVAAIRDDLDSGRDAILATMHASADRVALAEAEQAVADLGLTGDAAAALRLAMRRAVRKALFPASRHLRQQAGEE